MPQAASLDKKQPVANATNTLIAPAEALKKSGGVVTDAVVRAAKKQAAEEAKKAGETKATLLSTADGLVAVP